MIADPATRSIITPATEDDLPTVAALADTIWRQHYPGIISDAQIDYMLGEMYAPEALREFVDARHRGLDLLTVDGTPAGFAAYYVTAEAGVMKLDKLYVLQAYHGSGYGRLLIDHVARRARALGCETLTLNVNKYNARAIRAYEKSGFSVQDAVKADIGNGFVMDDFIMVKPLTHDSRRE